MRREFKIFLFTFLLFLVLITPIPKLRICNLLEECPPWRSFIWSPSLIQRTWNFLYPIKPVNVDSGPIEFYSEPEEEIPEPSPAPVPTYEPFEQWNTYASTKYKFLIKYPKSAEGGPDAENWAYYEGWGIFLRGKDSYGSYISIEVLKNPEQLTLPQLGNSLYSRGCAGMREIRDLGWVNVKFLGYDMLYVNKPHECLSDYQEAIYLTQYNNSFFSLHINYFDEPDSTYFKDLSNQILRTFEFITGLTHLI